MQKSREFAEKRQTVLSSGPNCLSFAPVAVIFKIHGQILYTLIYTYNDIYMVYTSVQCNVYLFPIVHICLTFKPKFERLVTKIFKLINLTYTYILWYFKFRKEAKVLWYQELRLAGGRILSPSTFKPSGCGLFDNCCTFIEINFLKLLNFVVL